jgi:glycine/D-amino acid oxidase-like deaminating enzyme
MQAEPAPSPPLSLWQATAVPAPALLPPLQGGAETQIAVVGAGFAGLSTALHLAERGLAVTVLEAGGALGDGASGRCGGHLLYGGRLTEAELRRHCGEAAGRRLHAFGAGAADDAFALIERLGLRCDAVRLGSIYAADSEAGLAEARHKFKALQAAGVPARWLDREAIAQAIGSAVYLGGYLNPKAGGVQPLSLVRELARAAQAAGARIHLGAPALALAPQGQGWRLRTPGGWLDARRVLLATNGQGPAIWPALRRTVLPVWSYQAATPPLPAAAGVLPGRPVVSDTRRLLNYFRRDAAGRLVMGGKGPLMGPRGSPALASYGWQRQTIARLFPALADAPLDYCWAGQVSVTLHRRPRLFALDDRRNVLASVACNGKGVAWNLALGPVLADALSGAAPIDALPLPPPEPARAIPLHALRPLYAAAGTAWLRWLDRRDERRPSAVTGA